MPECFGGWVLGCAVLGSAGLVAQQATFRARTDVVSVAVSVMKGRGPATGLKAADFEVTDNGVRQTVDAVVSDQVPIDVTLVLTGQSIDRTIEHNRALASAEATRQLLLPTDRLRIVWANDDVSGALVGADYSVATDPAARQLREGIAIARGVTIPGGANSDRKRSGWGIALADGLFYALAWPVDADRRHLVVVFTDGWDTTSTIEMDRLPTLAARSDAVLHAVLWITPGEDSRNGGGINQIGPLHPIRTGQWQRSYDVVNTVVRQTGGTLQRTNKAPEAMAEILADFRSSYVLRYAPKGVALPGWHELGVKITQPGSFRIRARKGYEGG